MQCFTWQICGSKPVEDGGISGGGGWWQGLDDEVGKSVSFIQNIFRVLVIACAGRWGYGNGKDGFCLQGAYCLG